MDPGRLRDRITFQKKKKQDGPVIKMDNDYEDYDTVWSEVRYLRGRNFYTARAANIKTDVEFIVRHRTDLDETMRIRCNNEIYNIDGILPLDNRKMYLIIKAHNVKYDL